MAYAVVAALLGAGWFPVLMAPRWTREWLLHDRTMVAWNVGLLAAASVITATLFRAYIARASGVRQNLARAVVVPLVGCAIYLTLWNLVSAVRDLRHGAFNLHDSLVLYYWGLTSTLLACWVVVPYGLVCQAVMSRLAPTSERSPLA